MRAQSQELVVNAVLNLKKKMHDPEWLRLGTQEAAAAILNLHRNTISKVMVAYEKGETFTDGKTPCRDRPVTNLDDNKQKILYQTITAYYSKSIAPRFNAVLQDFVPAVRADELMRLEADTMRNLNSQIIPERVQLMPPINTAAAADGVVSQNVSLDLAPSKGKACTRTFSLWSVELYQGD